MSRQAGGGGGGGGQARPSPARRAGGTPGRSGRGSASTPRSSRTSTGQLHTDQSNSLSLVREERGSSAVNSDEEEYGGRSAEAGGLLPLSNVQPRLARRNRKKRNDSEDDETSQDSSDQSTSPYPGDNHEYSNSEDDAIAVDCHTNPSEVIVKGKNVKKICVKFPNPHPPNVEDRPYSSRRRSYERSDSSRSLHRKSHTHIDASSSSQSSIDKGFVSRQNTVDEQEDLPLAVEETCGPELCVDSGTNSGEFDTRVKALPPRDSLTDTPLSDNTPVLPSIYGATNNSNNGPPPIHNSRSSFSNTKIDWDNKYKQDILAGLEYFERKGSDVHQNNRQLTQEIDRLKHLNAKLESDVAQLTKRNRIMCDEMDEMKIKLDQSEKENIILQDQSMSLWEGKVKAEEMFFEMKNSLQSQIDELKQQAKDNADSVDGSVDSNRKSTDLSLSQLGVGAREESKKNNQPKKTENRTISDEKFELMHRVQQLQDDLQKMSRDKDSINDQNCRLRQETVDMKTQLREKAQELDVQFKRFLSLKKSFNDVSEENDKLKLQLKGRKGSIGGNSTWPKQQEARAAEETIHLIDLPAGKGNISNTLKVASKPHPMAAAAAGRYKTKTPAFNFMGNSRSKSDGLAVNGDNLPPVVNTTR